MMDTVTVCVYKTQALVCSPWLGIFGTGTYVAM